MLCWLLLHNKVNQPYVYIYPLPPGMPSYRAPPPSHPVGHHRALGWAPCAIQQQLGVIHTQDILCQ